MKARPSFVNPSLPSGEFWIGFHFIQNGFPSLVLANHAVQHCELEPLSGLLPLLKPIGQHLNILN